MPTTVGRAHTRPWREFLTRDHTLNGGILSIRDGCAIDGQAFVCSNANKREQRKKKASRRETPRALQGAEPRASESSLTVTWSNRRSDTLGLNLTRSCLLVNGSKGEKDAQRF